MNAHCPDCAAVRSEGWPALRRIWLRQVRDLALIAIFTFAVAIPLGHLISH